MLYDFAGKLARLEERRPIDELASKDGAVLLWWDDERPPVVGAWVDFVDDASADWPTHFTPLPATRVPGPGPELRLADGPAAAAEAGFRSEAPPLTWVGEPFVSVPPRPAPEPGRAEERQVGGDHYLAMDVQPWDALEAWLSPEEFRGYLRGTAIVYLARFGAKGYGDDARRDVAKAEHYCQRLLEVLVAEDPA